MRQLLGKKEKKQKKNNKGAAFNGEKGAALQKSTIREGPSRRLAKRGLFLSPLLSGRSRFAVFFLRRSEGGKAFVDVDRAVLRKAGAFRFAACLGKRPLRGGFCRYEPL
jgi:hypothetical protein